MVSDNIYENSRIKTNDEFMTAYIPNNISINKIYNSNSIELVLLDVNGNQINALLIGDVYEKFISRIKELNDSQCKNV